MSIQPGVILLVEDNISDIRLTQRAFQQAKLTNEVQVAVDGAFALDYLFAQDESGAFNNPLPVLILLDLKLPKFDGLEVLRKIRKHERTEFVPVVILTSSKEQEDMVHSYQLGANSYIRKPVDFKAFVDAAGTLGLYWLVLNQIPSK